ncbi:MAG: hypothetical protein HY319_13405 [Armatimonadetes bacterium]|nr:hypothetical protein [Armatimonadota bacterium]
MKIFHTAARSHTPVAQNATTAGSQDPEDGIQLGRVPAIRVGLDVLDCFMGAGYLTRFPEPFSWAAGVVGVGHAIGAVGLAISTDGESTRETHYRLVQASGELMLALGHIGGAVGAGAWAWPALIGGLVTTNLSSYRHNTTG